MASRSLYRLPAPLLALLSLTALADATCYVAAYGLVGKQDGWFACPGTATSSGGVETCCIPGSECGEDSLCKTPDSLNPGNNQWYQAGCTDPSYSDSVCRNNCMDYTTTFIEWMSSEQQWMCCGDGGCNGTTTDDTFSAASPQSWKVITGAVSSSKISTKAGTTITRTPTTTVAQGSMSSGTGLSGSSPSSSVVQSSVASSSPTSQTSRAPVKPTSLDFKPSGAGRHPTKAGDNTSASSSASEAPSSSYNGNGLSTGAKAGIGVAVALAALALIAAVIAIFLLRRNRRVKYTVDEKRVRGSVSTGVSTNTHSMSAPPYQQAVEIGEPDRREELSQESALYELSSNNRWSK